MAFPVMIGSIATTLLNITDSAFLGRIGEVELGASAIGGILYFVFVMIGISIGTGSQILKRLGIGKMRLMSAPVHFNALSGFNLEVTDFVEHP